MRRAVRLTMDFHKPSGSWRISTGSSKVKFPKGEVIKALWEKKVPNGGELWLVNTPVGLVFFFYVQIPAGTKKSQRESFLTALAAQCHH